MQAIVNNNTFTSIIILGLFLCSNPISSLAQSPDTVIAMINKYKTLEKDSLSYQLEAIMMANEKITPEEAREMKTSSTSDPREQALYSMTIADAYYYKNNIDSSKTYYEEMLYLALEAKDSTLAHWAASNLTSCYEFEGNLSKALQLKKYYFKKLKSDPEKNGTHFYNVGNIYLKLGQIDSASYYLKKTVEIDRKNGNKRGMLFDLYAVIELNFRGERFEEALKACNDCIQLGQEIKYDRGLAYCHYLKSDVLRKLNNITDALDEIDLALEIDNKRGDESRLGRMALVKAKILHAGAYSSAVEWYESAERFSREGKRLNNEVSAILGLTTYYTQKGQFQKAKVELEKVAQLLGNRNESRIQKEYLQAANALHLATGDYKSANAVLEKRLEILATDNQELISSLAESIDQSYDLFQAERRNQDLEYQRAVESLEAKRKNSLYFGIGVILLLSSLVWYYAFQNQKNKMAVAANLANEDKLRSNNQILKKEMNNLRSQMNPHFLFNSLNSINDYVMHESPKTASIYLTKFSRLMRMILNNSKEEWISLEDEIKAIELYMELEQIRFKDKFKFKKTIDPTINLEGIFLPPMIIQPFLENSVKHGMKNLDRSGLIELNINELGENLKITIRDNGVGRKEAKASKRDFGDKHTSYGMGITSDRINILNSLYDIEASIEYRDLSSPSGTEVLIVIKPRIKENTRWKASELS